MAYDSHSLLDKSLYRWALMICSDIIIKLLIKLVLLIFKNNNKLVGNNLICTRDDLHSSSSISSISHDRFHVLRWSSSTQQPHVPHLESQSSIAIEGMDGSDKKEFEAPAKSSYPYELEWLLNTKTTPLVNLLRGHFYRLQP